MKGCLISIIAVFLCIVCVGLPIFFSATPTGVALWNSWFHKVQEADDLTNYDTLKKVEDTCRAMISSYEADRLTYEQYNNTDNQEWADQAKMRANKTAATYNTYLFENKYVWKNNIPADIKAELPYLE